MNKGDFIQYKRGEIISFDKLKKNHKNDWQEAINMGYFISVDNDKYEFTEKGFEFAWEK